MPMADFRDTFGAELTASLLADINSRIGVRAQAAAAEAPTVMRTTRKRARADGGLSEDAEPPTVLRTTRRSARAVRRTPGRSLTPSLGKLGEVEKVVEEDSSGLCVRERGGSVTPPSLTLRRMNRAPSLASPTMKSDRSPEAQRAA
jgi:hypothetical protein